MKNLLFWTLSVIITFSAIIYQRSTGPTYDKKTKIVIDETEYNFKLLRSHGGEKDCKIELEVADQDIIAILEYRKFPTRDRWIKQTMEIQDGKLTAILPHLPPAGKYEYKVTLDKGGKQYPLNEGNSVVIRFKGDVPAGILIPHIFFMFFAMFLSNLAGIMAIFKHKKYILYAKITLGTLFFGGLVLGPAVQWYAFGEAWAGVPFAWDLTDNKTLLAFIFWGIAVIVNRKKEKPIYSIIASIVMLAVYCIPHSMFGSELNPETGEIIQGWIQLFM
ncbi:MAG: hypothetical protein HQ541_07950 [Mariniphaga sp.]|nr:hypothetical protein [Mariniphaga sp.]